MKALLGLLPFVFALPAFANLGNDIQSQCSVPALNLQSNANDIAQGRLIEARQIKEYFTGQTASRSEVTADRDSLNHYRMQVKVEGVKFAQSKCILGLIEKRVGAGAKISKLNESAEGRKVLAEYEAYVKAQQKKLEEIRVKLQQCEKKNDAAQKRECQLTAYNEEVGLHEPAALFAEIQKAGSVGFIDGRQDVLSTYRDNRLNAIRDTIKELNDQLAASGDRFSAPANDASGTR